ncbi:MAG TPA: aminotransferase class I/II-fold pyridoxal phosphate-dependent enzyme, partial [Kineosporiaceae bacterium]
MDAETAAARSAAGRHPHHEGFDGFGVDRLRRRPGAKWARAGGDGVIAAWVADMDFAPCPAVRDRLEDLLAVGDLGYPDWWAGTPLRPAFAARMGELYGWEPDPRAVREVGDLVQGVQLVLHLATRPGDAVALHTPAYPPFLHSVTAAGRRLVPIPLQLRDGRWAFDAARLDALVAEAGVRVLILVNPHNPTGRVFTPGELEAVADVARRHDVLVVADEIHAELVHAPHRHRPFAGVSADAAARTVTLTSASKAFNLAGLRCAVAHFGSADLLAARDAQPSELFGPPNLFGVHAALAAWSPAARPWQDLLREHLRLARDQVVAGLGGLPGVRVLVPEATYLAWIDLRDV